MKVKVSEDARDRQAEKDASRRGRTLRLLAGRDGDDGPA